MLANCSYGVMTKRKGDLNGLLSYYGSTLGMSIS